MSIRVTSKNLQFSRSTYINFQEEINKLFKATDFTQALMKELFEVLLEQEESLFEYMALV